MHKQLKKDLDVAVQQFNATTKDIQEVDNYLKTLEELAAVKQANAQAKEIKLQKIKELEEAIARLAQ